MSGLVGTLVEAWDELRIHKLRVLLALIGVAVAVTAITGVTAAVQMLNQAVRESNDRQSGRAVTLDVYAWPSGDPATAPGLAEVAAGFHQVAGRYGITYTSLITNAPAVFRFPSGSARGMVQGVDVDYGTITRFSPAQGRWFTAADEARLSPTVVVNQAFLDAIGTSDLSGHPTALLQGGVPVTVEVIGSRPNEYSEEPPTAYLLNSQYIRWVTPAPDNPPQVAMKAWVPPELSKELVPLLSRDLTAALPGMQVQVQEPYDNGNPLAGAGRWVALGVGGFALLLGGLGLVNIALVTVRHRIREIGIRRSFGATSGRVFFGVLMESVVATVVAGAVGVVLAVAVIKNIPVDKIFGSGIQDMPPFPVAAALTGMASATAVGALAGLIPATVAVRVKVIDAIRY